MKIVEYYRGDEMITTDVSLISLEKVHWLLSNYSYWAQQRTMNSLNQSMKHSLNFGLFSNNSLIGYSRVVTDYTTFAWLCDVIIEPKQRGRGLGKWLIERITSHPDLVGVKRILLATRDAHGLYAQYGGFTLLIHPDRWMEKINSKADSL